MTNIKHYEMRLDVITPLHIGNADYKSKVKKNEYVYDYKNKMLTIIDTNKFINFLIKNNKLDSYIYIIEKNVMQNQKNVINLYDFLRNEGYLNRIHEFTRFQFHNITYKNMNDITLNLKNSYGESYIPGSSIKGAIINSLLVDYIIENRNEFKFEIQNLLNDSKNLDYNKFKSNAKNIVNNIYNTIIYGDTVGKLKGNGISISDTYKANNLATNIYQDIDEKLSSSKGSNYKLISNFREYIESGASFKFSIDLNLNQLNKGKFKIRSIDDIIHAINNSTKYLLEKTLYEKSSPYLVLGANTGYHQKTIIHALIINDIDRISVVRKLINLTNNPKNKIKFHLNDRYFSPRVINKISNENQMAGFVKIMKESGQNVK
jgi:CRISPR type III-A-associated RAMP protein Csm5